MLRDKLSLSDIIYGFEQVLRIEYSEADVERLIKNSKQRIEIAYGVKLSGNIYEDQLETRLIGDTLEVFISQILENMKALALIMSISLFDKRYGESLKEYNYLGFSEMDLKIAFKYLQDDVLYEKRASFFRQLIFGTSNLDISNMKRLLVIMIMLEHLGIKEGVALIAQYLYIGMR